MSGMQEDFRGILEAQRKLLSKYETAVSAYEASDVVKENGKLKEELESLKAAYNELQKTYEKTKSEADMLKWTLNEQILNERTSLIRNSQEKLDIYFKEECQHTDNQITVIEAELENRLQVLDNEAVKELKNEADEFRCEIERVQAKIKKSIIARKLLLKEKEEALRDQIDAKYEELKEQPVSQEVMEKRIKQNNMEVKIGLNWINKAGMLLILVGIVSVMRYSFKYFFSNEVKGIFGLLLGIAFLMGGEYCQKKEKRVFAQGLIGGGMGIFYLTVFCSYFILKIINMPVALILSVLISVTAFVLALRYDSKTIAALALIGGYLPLLAYSLIDQGISGVFVYVSMGYVLILNGVTLMIGLKRNWSVVQYVSFFTNMPIAAVLAFIADEELIGILYSFINFAMYMGILFVGPISKKLKLNAGRIMMMGLNTVVSCIIIWLLFIEAGLRDWMGLLALIFCLSYYALSMLTDKLAVQEKETRLIFILTALTFAVLVIPLQFDAEYISLGWLTEGVLLIVYGLKSETKHLENAGKVIFGLCIAAFYWFRLDFVYVGTMYYVNYTSVAAGILLVLYMYLVKYRNEIFDEDAKVVGVICYKYFSIVNIWLYLLVIGSDLIDYLSEQMGNGYADVECLPLQALWLALISALILTAMSRIELLYDKGIKVVTFIGFCMVDLICIINNCISYVSYDASGTEQYLPLAVIILILWNVLVLVNINKLIKYIVVKQSAEAEIYPLAMAIFIIGNTTIIMGSQFNIALSSIFISIFYIICAFVLVACGFKYGYRWIRYWGLALCIFALGKLFIFDFAMGVETIYKIISYFSFGVILLIISYLYQKFSKRMERPLPASMKEVKHEE